MDEREMIRELVLKALRTQCSGQPWTKYVTIEQIVDAMMGGLDLTVLEAFVEAKKQMKQKRRPYTLSMMRVEDKRQYEKVAGCWEIYAVRDDEQHVITFSTKPSKVLYTFFMLHVGEKISLAGLQKYHDEMKKIALALYADPELEHTAKTLREADDIATKLCSRFGLTSDKGSNEQRSQAFSKAKKAVSDALFEMAQDYVIQGNSRDKDRVLRLPAGLVKVPEAFRDEVIGWQGGFAA